MKFSIQVTTPEEVIAEVVEDLRRRLKRAQASQMGTLSVRDQKAAEARVQVLAELLTFWQQMQMQVGGAK